MLRVFLPYDAACFWPRAVDHHPLPCYNPRDSIPAMGEEDLMGRIVVVGSLNMDLVVKADRMPVPGETIRGHGFHAIPGGKGANQAAAIALLGGEVAMVGHVGDDVFGPQLVGNLQAKGVDTRHVSTLAGVATGTALIIVDGRGENSIVIAAGANGLVSPRDIDSCDDLLRQAEYLVLQLEIPLETVSYAIQKATHYGLQVVLNPAPASDLPAALLGGVRYLVPNESEAAFLSGQKVSDVATARRAAQRLHAQGVPVVIITLGSQGALVLTDDGAFQVPAPRVQVVDTTAAGDAFVGGLVASLNRGLSLRQAVRCAVCAGAVAVTRFGAQTSLPTHAEVQSLCDMSG